jgi:pimeloyl-ACP methyl ester carboxylesterase
MTDMSSPIANVTTRDGFILHGLLTEPVKPATTIDIHIHGAGGNFYGNSYFEGLTLRLVDLGMAYLSTNNRGAGVYELEKGSISHGVSLEKFADCVLDIDAWIECALNKAYENIVLEGHSYGTEKIVYYMHEGSHRDRVKGVILLGFSENVGVQMKYEQSLGKSYQQEAQELASKGEHERLLSDLFGLCGELPISAQTYLHCFTEHSANALALPLRQGGNLTSFQNIHVPILGVIGDQDEREYTVLPIKDAVELLKTENSRAEVYQVEKSDHVFSGKEAEVIALIADFMQRNILV